MINPSPISHQPSFVSTLLTLLNMLFLRIKIPWSTFNHKPYVKRDHGAPLFYSYSSTIPHSLIQGCYQYLKSFLFLMIPRSWQMETCNQDCSLHQRDFSAFHKNKTSVLPLRKNKFPNAGCRYSLTWDCSPNFEKYFWQKNVVCISCQDFLNFCVGFFLYHWHPVQSWEASLCLWFFLVVW